MANYVVLVNWTAQGVEHIEDTVSRAEKVSALAETMGGNVKSLVWTMGRYDLVILAEFPDDETVAAWTGSVAKKGNVSTQTMRAFTASEVESIIAKMK